MKNNQNNAQHDDSHAEQIDKNSPDDDVINLSKDTKSETKVIKFRPHHFMCTISFRGKGYSLDFIKNYKSIVKSISENEDAIIEVVEYMDDVCRPCPNRLDDVVCKTQENILKLDKLHKDSLGLEIGQKLSWKEAKNLIKTKMTVEKFHKSCDSCSWKNYGVCQKALEELLSESE